MKTKITIITILAAACLSGFAADNIGTNALTFIRIKRVAQMQGKLLATGNADSKAGQTRFTCAWSEKIGIADYSTATTLPAGLTLKSVLRTPTNCTFTVSGPLPADRQFGVIALKP